MSIPITITVFEEELLEESVFSVVWGSCKPENPRKPDTSPTIVETRVHCSKCKAVPFKRTAKPGTDELKHNQRDAKLFALTTERCSKCGVHNKSASTATHMYGDLSTLSTEAETETEQAAV